MEIRLKCYFIRCSGSSLLLSIWISTKRAGERDVWSTPVDSKLKANSWHNVQLTSLRILKLVHTVCALLPLLVFRLCFEHYSTLKLGWLCYWGFVFYARSVYIQCRSLFFRFGIVTLVYCSQTDLDVALLNAILYFYPFLWMVLVAVDAVAISLSLVSHSKPS